MTELLSYPGEMNNSETTRGENTRREILVVALKLFIDQGYHGTSMRQISTRAGIALSGIYNHFPSKEDLFIQVLLAYHPAYQILPVLKASQGETIEELVQDAARRMVSDMEQRSAFVKLLLVDLVEFNGAHIQLLFERVFPQVLTFVSGAIGGKEELRNIPLPIILRAFISLFFSYLFTELLLGERLSGDMHEKGLDYFVDIFLHGILEKV